MGLVREDRHNLQGLESPESLKVWWGGVEFGNILLETGRQGEGVACGTVRGWTGREIKSGV